jgi:hypothetical protein
MTTVLCRGVKPVNDVTVKTVLKSFLARVRKEGRWTGRAARPQRAPVEDVTTQVHDQCRGSDPHQFDNLVCIRIK